MALATKEQERKALEKIKEIVAGLGDDSYVGTALKGCFEIAEQNIENDFGDSMMDRSEMWHDTAINHSFEIDALKDELTKKQNEIDDLFKRIKEQKDDIKMWQGLLDQSLKKINEIENEVNNERKDLTITIGDDEHTTGFKSIKLCRNNLFDFIVIEQRDGWTESYKLNEIKSLTIE